MIVHTLKILLGISAKKSSLSFDDGRYVVVGASALGPGPQTREKVTEVSLIRTILWISSIPVACKAE